MAEEASIDNHSAVPVEDPDEDEAINEKMNEERNEGQESWFKRKVLGDYDYG